MTTIERNANAAPGGAIRVRSLRVSEEAEASEAIRFTIEERELQLERDDDLIVEIAAAGVNPSDVKAAMGMMPYAVWPRTPGRDFAGRVVAGPADLVGKAVFGTGGDIGIRRDGTHASHVLLNRAAIVEKPDSMPMQEAAGIGVPFLTAYEGFTRAGMPTPSETVLVMGANGKVGQAAIQIATMCGARVIGAVRRPEPYRGHANGPVTVVDHSSVDVAEAVRNITSGQGADIVFNTVGDPYYDAATRSLAAGGRQIFIAAVNKVVSFDIFAFYRGRHTYIGIDTLAFTAVQSAALLRKLAPGFASGKLKPFAVAPRHIYGLERAAAAYCEVIGSALERIVLVP